MPFELFHRTRKDIDIPIRMFRKQFGNSLEDPTSVWRYGCDVFGIGMGVQESTQQTSSHHVFQTDGCVDSHVMICYGLHADPSHVWTADLQAVCEIGFRVLWSFECNPDSILTKSFDLQFQPPKATLRFPQLGSCVCTASYGISECEHEPSLRKTTPPQCFR